MIAMYRLSQYIKEDTLLIKTKSYRWVPAVLLKVKCFKLTRGEIKSDILTIMIINVALEYATGVTATNVGKPTEQFFKLALKQM
jgi:hypothetical protein